MRALRRYGASADRFYEDILELQGYFGVSRLSRRRGHAGKERKYVVHPGSSTFGPGLRLARLPYACLPFRGRKRWKRRSHLPSGIRPSAQLAEPYVIAGSM